MADAKNFDRELLVCIYDSLNWLVWSRTEDGAEGRNKPESLYNRLYRKETHEDDVRRFDTPEDFEKAWEKIRRSHVNNS